MDALSRDTLIALEKVIVDTEKVHWVTIKQDVDKELLEITNGIGQFTVVNCRWNSASATIRQVCGHLYKGTLFSYGDNYIIGAVE